MEEIIKEEKEKENIIQIEKQEIKDKKEPLVTLSQKIQPEKDVIINETDKIKNKEKKETNQKEKEKENKKNKNMIPKHSFYININTKKLLLQEIQEGEYNSENMSPNKLNSSFTQKLTDSLKENVFKMRNPKAKIANKDKEINKALKEIKQSKKGKKNIQKKENKTKNNKIKRIHNEPLFKGNKKDHTIIHNRNASAVNKERKKNNKIEQTEKKNNNNNKTKIKNHKHISSSVEKTNKNHMHNKNIDLKNNIKKVKIPNINEKDKINNKNRENSTEKRKSKKYNKFINKNINNSSAIKRNEKNTTSSGAALMTVSNKKHSRINSLLNSSTNKKNDLKTPSKNINKYYIEPFYKRLNNSNLNKYQNESHNLSHAGNLNKALELSEVKETNKHNKLSNIKASNHNYQKSIRLTYKNIEKEDFIKNDINSEKKIPFKYAKVKSDINLSFDKNNINNSNNNNNKSVIKRKINHLKSNSIEVNGKSRANKYLNGFRNNKEYLYRNCLKYAASILKTDKNENKFKKYINLSSYEGRIKTEINNEKKGNQKFWEQKQEKQIIKECYYKGPIDLKNIFLGNSIDEIQEILVGILIKNRIKFWKMNSFRFYCKKNGESFVIRIYILQDKIKINKSDGIANNKNKEEEKVSEFDINKKNENEEIKNNNENNSNNKNDKCKIFYICVLSKESNNKEQARKLNKIINKKLSEIFKK